MLEQVVREERLMAAGSGPSMPSSLAFPGRVPPVSKMMAHICHDLRLPLASILANAEFLAQSDLTEVQRADLYQEVRRSIDRMDEMVSSLLEYSRDRDTFRPAVRNVVETVQRTIRMTCMKKNFRRITVKHRHQGLAMGWFDPYRFERVLANLLMNACEAVSPDHGRIVVTTTGDPSCLHVEIWDNGPGIHPAIQDSLFQPFVSHGKAEGSGLGLAIAKRIVEEHGGRIYLDGKIATGTLFRIAIPFAIPQRAVRAGLVRMDELALPVNESDALTASRGTDF